MIYEVLMLKYAYNPPDVSGEFVPRADEFDRTPIDDSSNTNIVPYGWFDVIATFNDEKAAKDYKSYLFSKINNYQGQDSGDCRVYLVVYERSASDKPDVVNIDGALWIWGVYDKVSVTEYW